MQTRMVIFLACVPLLFCQGAWADESLQQARGQLRQELADLEAEANTLMNRRNDLQSQLAQIEDGSTPTRDFGRKVSRTTKPLIGRYTISVATLSDSNPVTLLLDTSSGHTWQLSDDRWVPVELVESMDSSQLDVMTKDSVRYGGKTFQKWRLILKTDLDPASRAQAIKALAAIGRNRFAETAISDIIEAVKEYDQKHAEKDEQAVIQAATTALVKIGHDAALPALIRQLNEGDVNSRRFAIGVVGRMGSTAKTAVPSLLKAMTNESPDVRQLAISVVSRIDPQAEGFFQALMEALRDEDTNVCSRAMTHLGMHYSHTESFVPELVKLTKHNDRRIRRIAVDLLYGLGPEARDAVAALSEALSDEDRRVQQTAIRALRRIGPEAKDAVAALIEAIDEVHPGDRSQVIGALGQIGREAGAAVPVLANLLKDENEKVQMEARRALDSITK